MMTIDKTIEAIEKLGDDFDEIRGGVFVYDEHGSQCDRFFVADLKALAAELKQLREFVGAMDHIEIGKWDGLRTDEHTFAFMTNDKYYTGTDPFDAWQKKKGESK